MRVERPGRPRRVGLSTRQRRPRRVGCGRRCRSRRRPATTRWPARVGCRPRRRTRRRRRQLEDRTQSREASGDLDGRSRGTPHAQVAVVICDGYKAHVAVEPSTGLITACDLTPANQGDGPTGIKLLANETDSLDVLADSAYGSGDSLAALNDAEHRIVIKLWPLARNSKLGDDQFGRDDFSIDYTARTVTCPNGTTTHITDKGSATFGTKCRGCPVRSRCTSAIDGRTFIVREHDEHLAANRLRWRTDTDLADDYRQHRPMVERTIAWLVTNGHRRVRHHGVARNKIAFSTRAATVNLKRLINLGLDHDGTTWNLAPTT